MSTVLSTMARSLHAIRNRYMYSKWLTIYCEVAEFFTLLSRNWERIYIMKSPLFGSQEQNPSPKRQGHSYFCIICLFFFVIFLFSCEQKLCDEQKALRRTFQLTAFRQPSASVVSPSAASPSPRRSIQHQLKIIASSLYDHLPKRRINFVALASYYI